MTTQSETIQLLKDVIFDVNCKRMNKSCITGFLGELMVIEKLKENNFNPIHEGKQKGYDILLDQIKIDVKTSTLKDDGYEKEIWGWTLAKENQKIQFDLIVCVALDEKMENSGFYLITGSNIPLFNPPVSKRFGSITKRFVRFPFVPKSTGHPELDHEYEKSETHIKSGNVIVVPPDGNLGNAIKSFF